MTSRCTSWFRAALLACASAALLGLLGCSDKSNAASAQTSAIDLQSGVVTPFRFVAYGDTRFHDPSDSEVANPAARAALVKAIAEASPAFVCFTGDIVYDGPDADDWKVWDREAGIFREKGIPVYPALGNHDLHAPLDLSLNNYFQRFPDLKKSRYYSVRAANTLLVVIDSALDEVGGPQGQWLSDQLAHVPADVNFLFVMDHHPPYTSSSDVKKLGGGHSSRAQEHALAKILEERQAHSRFRIVMFSGHVHNYERHEHGGVTYFVTGGGGAHAYPIERAVDDPFQSKEINYHYLLVEVDRDQLKVTMNRLDLSSGKALWTQPDTVKIGIPTTTAAAAAH